MTEINTIMLNQLILTEPIFKRLVLFCIYLIPSLTVEPIAAGVLTSLGGVLGKLSGSQDVVGDSYILWLLMIILMIISNTLGCRCFLRALDASPDTIRPTVISSALGYLFSALMEVLFFDGNMSLKWWIGNALVLQGIALLAGFNSSPDNYNEILNDTNNNGHLLDDDDEASDDGGDDDDDDEDEQFVDDVENFFLLNDQQLVDNIRHYFKDRRRLG